MCFERSVGVLSYMPYARIDDEGELVEDDRNLGYIDELKEKNFLPLVYLKTYSLSFYFLLEKLGICSEKNGRWDLDNGETTYPIPELPAANWPIELKSESFDLTGKILLRWRKELEKMGVVFMVVYLPAGEKYLDKPYRYEMGWISWLSVFCRENGIEFVDISSDLRDIDVGGGELFDENGRLTKKGHWGCAKILEELISNKLRNKD